VDGMESHVPGEFEHDALRGLIVACDEDRGGDPVDLRIRQMPGASSSPNWASVSSIAFQGTVRITTYRRTSRRLPHRP
ncbi:MAG TPA: hypothetical protein VE522_04015, partial [Actinomycetota bacterium]|nr:hypothetical protein [Actinomycetota bacterium]